jgi:hypothetical protein
MNNKYIIYIVAIAIISYFVYVYVNKKPIAVTEPTPKPTPTPAEKPKNDGTFPDWTNKDYTPNVTVYFEGALYKTLTSVYGNNNNTPNLDGRWVRL